MAAGVDQSQIEFYREPFVNLTRDFRLTDSWCAFGDILFYVQLLQID